MSIADLTGPQAGLAINLTDPDPRAQELARDINALAPRSRASLDECLAAITDLTDTGVDPLLRRVVHRIFERSVAEFFADETATSTQLPAHLVRYTVPDPQARPLPEPGDEPTAGLAETLAQRRSRRNFDNRAMTAQELGDMLHLAVARNGVEDGYGTRNMPLFPYPSIGGLDAVELGVVVNRLEGFEPGYYRYDKIGHGLVPVLRGDMRMALVNATFESEWLFYAPVVLVLANNQDKVSWKYKTRGYRISTLDLGAVLQNIYLSSTAHGLSCCAVAGYDDAALNALLRHPVGDVAVGALVPVGPPAVPGGAGTNRR